ncbi:hypothetical protein JEM67_20825 [Serratia sp. PAMC26656]|uniref:hypothetical protein n=1 Tax=Serratia sp. PAMC26656 TaxID=2775909 RepID=UPI0018F601BB|nr:hypothetical protein [Serratia sp. PAMC26656]MBJ7892243.1 hypothetical protein [Serratia sp. PAMC26656]
MINKIIIATVALLALTSAPALSASCAMTNVKGFHSVGEILCLDKVNYAEEIAKAQRMEITSFSIINDEMVIYTVKSSLGTAAFFAGKEGFVKILGELPSGDIKKSIEGINNISIAPITGGVYFITDAWATSGAVHMLPRDIWMAALESNKYPSNNDIKYITDGNYVQVIKTGKHAGNLIVNKHKYKDGGGSYDPYYLVSSSGKEVKEIGESKEQVDSFLYKSGAKDRIH